MVRKNSGGIGGYIEMAIAYWRIARHGVSVGLGSKAQKKLPLESSSRKIHSTKPL